MASGLDLRFLGGALALFLLTIVAIRWIGRMLKDTVATTASNDTTLLPLMVAGSPAGEVAAKLRQHGIISPDQLAGMSAKEQQFLLEAAARLPATEGTPKPAVIRTPRNTPRGVAVNALYCPTCAALLSREAVLAAGGAPCPKCAHTVAAREAYGKLVVTVALTA